ncbi:MAG: leucyl aminopeptidase [Pirellulaceae bacterium]|jgi:leucyl aminopeptidase|nr:leucyl aminopeptidase [Pirellulaceae bacterium]
MPVTTTKSSLADIEAEGLVLGVYAELPLPGPAAEFDRLSGGTLTSLFEAKEISGKKGDVTTLLAPQGVKTRTVVVVGLGPQNSLDRGTAYRASAAAAKSLSSKERGKVVFALADQWSAELVEAAVCGSVVGCVGQDIYRAKKSRFPLANIVWAGVDDAAAERGAILGEGVNLTRRLVNEPPSDMYPESFAAAARKVAAATGLAIEVWDAARLESERCGALLAVARGSVKPPRLVILRYQGAAADKPLLALVGKGVTFDSGGLSIKPTDGMKTMKCDMAGAATVLGAMQAIAQLKLPVNVIGLCGLVENMISGDSYKLGDVLRARNGKTIEVLNTDAEGRLVLADVLDVCVQENPARIVDLATLTGACVVALGNDVAGLMTNDEAWCGAVKSAADTCGEPMWQLPMFPEFGEQIRSEVADIKNVGDGRWGGAITAAKFLEEFVAGKPWVHIDIAGPSFLEGAKPWLDAGGSGFGVRTLVELAARGV